MDKIKQLVNNLYSNNLIDSKVLFEDIIKEKIYNKLNDYELDESMFKFRRNKLKSELKRSVKRNLVNPKDDFVNDALVRFIKKKANPIYLAREDMNEDKHPHTVSISDAHKILKRAGYKIVRSGGKHQSYWRHETDPSKPDVALPDHSHDLSPGITRKLFKLLPEHEIQEILFPLNEELKGFKLDYTYSKGNKAAKVYRSPDNKFMTTFHQNNKKIADMTTHHDTDEEGAHDLAKYWTEK